MLKVLGNERITSRWLKLTKQKSPIIPRFEKKLFLPQFHYILMYLPEKPSHSPYMISNPITAVQSIASDVWLKDKECVTKRLSLYPCETLQ